MSINLVTMSILAVKRVMLSDGVKFQISFHVYMDEFDLKSFGKKIDFFLNES